MAVGRTISDQSHRCWSITLGLVDVQELLEAIPLRKVTPSTSATGLLLGCDREFWIS
jgi:hypothetical protein